MYYWGRAVLVDTFYVETKIGGSSKDHWLDLHDEEKQTPLKDTTLIATKRQKEQLQQATETL